MGYYIKTIGIKGEEINLSSGRFSQILNSKMCFKTNKGLVSNLKKGDMLVIYCIKDATVECPKGGFIGVQEVLGGLRKEVAPIVDSRGGEWPFVVNIKPKIYTLQNPVLLKKAKSWKSKSGKLEMNLRSNLQVIGGLLDIEERDYINFLKAFQENNVQEQTDEKIARICWNSNGWKKPSGREGKSKNKDSYEHKFGFGHEEWLLDTEKMIDGYHYGYLQPVGRGMKKHQGETFNISLYSINSVTKERWWIGRIKNVEIITEKESKEILSEYRKRGWFEEMVTQLKNAEADARFYGLDDPYGFVNLRYKPINLELFDAPLRFSNKDTAVPSTYYVLLSKTKEPNFEMLINQKFIFKPGYTEKKRQMKVNYAQRESDVDLQHNRMQMNIYNYLVKKYGKENVGAEQPTGYGSAIDIVVKDGNSYIYYEIKTSNSLKICIREALAQLMEYALWSNENRAKELVVISQNYITKLAEQYLQKLRKEFNIPINYKRYNPDIKALE